MGRVGVNVGGLVKGSSSMLPATIHSHELTILVNAWQIFLHFVLYRFVRQGKNPHRHHPTKCNTKNGVRNGLYGNVWDHCFLDPK